MAKEAQDLVPDGHRPEEFMDDATLANYHVAALEALSEDDRGRDAAVQAARAAKVAAAITAAAAEVQ